MEWRVSELVLLLLLLLLPPQLQLFLKALLFLKLRQFLKLPLPLLPLLLLLPLPLPLYPGRTSLPASPVAARTDAQNALGVPLADEVGLKTRGRLGVWGESPHSRFVLVVRQRPLSISLKNVSLEDVSLEEGRAKAHGFESHNLQNTLSSVAECLTSKHRSPKATERQYEVAGVRFP
jgi:hypothetical protein